LEKRKYFTYLIIYYDRPILEMRGIVSQDYIGGFSMKRESINTTHKSIQYHIWSWSRVITHLFYVLEFIKAEAPKDCTKDNEFMWKHFSYRQTHTLHPIRGRASSDNLHLWVPVGNPALIGLNLSLTALIGVAGGRRKIFTCTRTRYNKSKAWTTTLTKTYPSWSESHKTRHARTSKVIRTQDY
jgi:hypothetical protein